jgi:hypothetical protein
MVGAGLAPALKLGILSGGCPERSMGLIPNDYPQQNIFFVVVVEMRTIWPNTLQNGISFPTRPPAIILSGLSFSFRPLPVAALVLIVIVVALVVVRVKSVHWRKALEHQRERYASGLALVRYVQLNRQCSEIVAYQRLATFVKKHVPADGSIERMVAYDRQCLLERAQGLLVQDPGAIDKI